MTEVRDRPAVDMEAVQPSPRGFLLPQAALWLVVAGAVPALAHLGGADWLLPPLVLLSMASLVRGGRGLLDRLMIAIGILIGLTCLLGFAGIYRPDLLTNVNVSTAALAVIGVAHLLTRRTPHLPRPRQADVVPILGALGMTGLLAWRVIRSDPAGRLAMWFIGEDGARHVSAFGGILRAGGYLYLRPENASPDVALTMLRYPQGLHFTTALLDRFLPGPDRTGMVLYDHYAFWCVAGFGLFTLAMLWAATWIAGPAVRGWRLWVLAAVVLGWLVTGDLPGMLIYGAPSEVLGLTLLMLLIALLTRKTLKMRERIITIALLLIAIGLTYNLLLPMAGVAVLAWLPRNWWWLRRHLVFFVLSALVVAVAAPIASLVGIMRDDQLVNAITAGGQVYEANRISLLLLGGAIAAAVLSPTGRRSPLWRSYPVIACAVGVPVVLLWLYQLIIVGHSTYYFDKAMHAVSVTVAVGTGAVLLLLPAPSRAMVRTVGGYLLRNKHIAVLCAMLLVASIGVFISSDYRRKMTSRTENPARAWITGHKQQYYVNEAGAVLLADKLYPAEPGRMSIVLGTQWGTTYLMTLYLSTVQDTSGVTSPIVYHQNRRDVNVENPERTSAVLRTLPGKLRLIAITPDSAEFAQRYQRENPGQDVETVNLAWAKFGCKDRHDVQRPDAPTCPR